MISSSDSRERSARSNILVFDGEPLILDLLASVLQREGFRVTATRLGDEAMNLVSAHNYDLAIADLELRTMDGCRLIGMIRQVSPDTRVAEAFLAKPFGIGDLLSAVHGVLDGRAVDDAYGTPALVPCESTPVLAAHS
jgi:DNA-binding response OmpR family regulator